MRALITVPLVITTPGTTNALAFHWSSPAVSVNQTSLLVTDCGDSAPTQSEFPARPVGIRSDRVVTDRLTAACIAPTLIRKRQ